MRIFLLSCLLATSVFASVLKKTEKRALVGATELGYSGYSEYSRSRNYDGDVLLGTYATDLSSSISLGPTYASSYNLGSPIYGFGSPALDLSGYGIGRSERIAGVTINREVPHSVPVPVRESVPVPVAVIQYVSVPVNVDYSASSLNIGSGLTSAASSAYANSYSGLSSGSYSGHGSSSDSSPGSGYYSGINSRLNSGSYPRHGSYSGVQLGSYSSLESSSSFGSELSVKALKSSPDSGYSYSAPSKKFNF